MATPNVTSEMAQFFDFGEAAVPEVSQETTRPGSRSDGHRVGCPAHGQEGDDGCLCHSFDVALPNTLQDEVAPVEEWNSDFSSWLPRYLKPTHPCDYCRSKSLECFIYNAGNGKSSGCSPCNALFRACSFNNPERMPLLKSKTALDTLDSVSENSERCFGGLTGKKPLRSLGHMGPIEDNEPEEKPKKGAAAARFPRAAVKILKDWMVEHIDHPYPTDEEKEILKDQTGLTMNQISNWMANTRRRQKAHPKRSASPSIRPSTEPVNIPPGRTWDSLNPFERWKHSPPENEPAPMQAIVQNVETFDFPETTSSASSYRKGHSNDSTGSFSIFRAPSTTSLETGLTAVSSGSMNSHNSTYSHGSRHSLGSLNSLKSKERRRRRRMPTRTPKVDLDEAPRLFQCTFCTDRFKSKYDWSRHEKSLHLSLEKWICAPIGEVITCSSSGQHKCVYCDKLDPSKEHLEIHNHRACEEKGMEARTFYRKDHLRQHLRLMHGCKMTPSMESWKSEAQYIKTRCGFCGMNFDKWQDRVDHLAKEFRNGAAMRDWKGCRGLDPHVAAQVTNAMPPYLIANESKSPFPFSATNSSSMKHPNLLIRQDDLEYLLPNEPLQTEPMMGKVSSMNISISPTTASKTTPQTGATSVSESPNRNATCWEILTLRLGRFARQHIEQNGPGSVTDAMLQREARIILYDEDDSWNQTAADNPEWLNKFKKGHGIDHSLHMPDQTSQHGILEDLGIRHDAQLDQSFNFQNFECVNKNLHNPATRALTFECSLSGSMKMSQAGLASVPFSLPTLSASTTASGVSNLPTTTFAELQGLNVPINELDFTGVGGLYISDNGEIRTTSAPDGANKKAFGSFMTPITETSCTAAGEPIIADFGFPSWDQVGDGFDIAASTAPLDPSMLVSSSFDTVGDMGAAELTADPQAMRWDDNELAFDMDMDMDLGMGSS